MKKMTRVLLSLVVTLSCSAPTELRQVSAIQITTSPPQLESGATVQLSASITDTRGNEIVGRPVTWSSSRHEVASVSNTGRVTAGDVTVEEAQTAYIKASTESFADSVAIVVTPIPATSVHMNRDTVEVIVPDAVTLTATVYGRQGTITLTRATTWTTTDTALVEIVSFGSSARITPKRTPHQDTRTATILVESGSHRDSTTIVIQPEYISFPDPVFAAALTRMGFHVTDGRMRTSVAYSITQFCISGAYGEAGYRPPEGGPYTGTPTNAYIQSSAGLEKLKNLQTFRLENQQVTSIDLSGLRELRKVSLWGNPLTSLDVRRNIKLTLLGLSETSLREIDVSTLSELEEINFQNAENALPYTTRNGTQVSGFRRIDLSNNLKIQRVYIWNNGVTDSTFILPTNRQLYEFWASKNKFTQLDFSSYPNLTHIIVMHNDLERLDIRTVAQAWGGTPLRVYTEGNPRLNEIRATNIDVLNARAALPTGGVFIDPWTRFVP